MKKTLLSLAAAIFAVCAFAEAPASKTWNFSVEPFASKASLANETVDGLEVVGTLNITDNKKSFEGVDYTKRLQTGGKSSATNRVVKFEVPGACTINVVCCSASSSDASRAVVFSAGEYSKEISRSNAKATGVDKATAEYTGTEPTTIFISATGGINYYSISYTTGGAEEPAPAEGATFSLVGQWPTGNFGTINTPVAIDLTAKSVKFENFLGSNTTLVCSFKERDANVEEGTIEKIYDLIFESGATQDGTVSGIPAYSIDGVSDKDVIFTKDGVNTMKLSNLKVMFSTWSYIQNLNGSANSKFKVTLYISSPNSTWTDGAWGTESSVGYFDLTADVTTTAGGETGIADITVEDENAPVEYYNLQGVRISEPAAGQIVIRRQGSKVTKMVVR